VTGTCHHSQLLLLRWSTAKLFPLGWAGTSILPISASV
jgi:hypothetical protein